MNFYVRIRNNFWLVILSSSLLVGILSVTPQFLLYFNVIKTDNSFILKDYQNFGDEAHGYLPRIREVFDGHFPPADLYFNPNAPTIYNILPPLLFSPLMFLFQDINTSYIAANFVFPLIIFWLFYLLGMAVTKSRFASLFFAFLGTLTPIYRQLPLALIRFDKFLNVIVKNFYPGVQTLLDKLFLARVDDPLLTFLTYLPAIIFLWKFWQNPGKKNFAVLAGVFAGLLFYTYFHYWVYWVVILVLLFFWSFVSRKEFPERFKNMLLMVLIIGFISIPYFISYYRLSRLASVSEFNLRLGLEIGRGIRFLSIWPHYLVYAIVAISTYLLYFKKEKNKAILFFAFLGAAVIIWNIQLATGFVPHPEHFQRSISPVLFAVLFSLFFDISFRLKVRWPFFKKTIPAVLIILSVLLITKKTVNALMFISPPQDMIKQYSFSKDLTESWRWINANLAGEPGILSPSTFTSLYLVSFTSARPYVPGQVLHTASNFEVEERYLKANKVFEVPWSIIEASIQGIGEEHENLYAQYFREESQFDIEFASTKKWIPELYMSVLRERYEKMSTDLDSVEADYIYVGPEEKKKSSADFEGRKDLMLIFENSSVKIYKIIHQL